MSAIGRVWVRDHGPGDVDEGHVAVPTAKRRELVVRQHTPSQELVLSSLASVRPHLEHQVVTILVSVLAVEVLVPHGVACFETSLGRGPRVGLPNDLEGASAIVLACQVDRREAHRRVDLNLQPRRGHGQALHDHPQAQQRDQAPWRIAHHARHGQRRVEAAGPVELRSRQDGPRDKLGLVALIPVVKLEQQAVSLHVAVLVSEVLAPPRRQGLLYDLRRGLRPALRLDLAVGMHVTTHHGAEGIRLAVGIRGRQVPSRHERDLQGRLPGQQVRVPMADVVV
mmetsp:Transcript_93604/g.302952  ORF Transcript_93604/g.302952 Transcript_93604/m.302952 type:complete len:282 (-) Transcript_93604:447-1292(-)